MDPKIRHSVTLNGYRLDLPKQTYIELPLQIAEVISNSFEQTDMAILKGQIGSDQAKLNALL